MLLALFDFQDGFRQVDRTADLRNGLDQMREILERFVFVVVGKFDQPSVFKGVQKTLHVIRLQTVE